MTVNLVEAGHVATLLSQAVHRGGFSLTSVPGLLLRLITEDFWQVRIDDATGRTYTFDTFEEFVTTGPTRGLGTTVQILEDLCRHRVDVLAELTAVRQRKPGNPVAAIQPRTEVGTFDRIVDNVHGSVDHEPEPRPTGNTRAAGIRKLMAHAPEVLDRVKSGEVSVHRALVDAGLRKVPGVLEKLRALWKKASDDDKRAFLDEFLSER